MERTTYRGTVRDSAFEDERDSRMLMLKEQGLSSAVIAQRMGLSIASVRSRVRRARDQREHRSTSEAQRKSGKLVDDGLERRPPVRDTDELSAGGAPIADVEADDLTG